MTGTPSNPPGLRGFPEPEGPDLDQLARAARSPKRMPFDGVVAIDWHDPAGDALVFGAVFAVQHIDGEPWIVRAVLRQSDAGPPVLSRVTLAHFNDPGREVTGAIVREIRLGTIRDRALVRLRERGANFAAMSAMLPEPWVMAAREAAEKAGRGQIASGAHGAYPRDHYRHIAERHLALTAMGRRDVLKALCEEESKRLDEEIGRERMRDWVKKATRFGYLEPGAPGKVGRRPGPSLLAEREIDRLEALENEEGVSDG
jgi:hypothetical protein